MTRNSLKTIAAALEVSAMTVSRALRGSPGVSDSLRKRIQTTAKRLGYRPDPVVGRLMHQLRRGGRAAFRASLCAVTDIPIDDEPAYCERLRRHAGARARELGFSLSVLRIPRGDGSWPTATRTLAARGVEGVLLLPLVEPTSVEAAAWQSFSVVAATSSITAPRFHEVVPNHAANTRLLVERLAAQGLRRLGFVGLTTHAERTHHAYSCALAWHHVQAGLRCRPLFYSPDTTPEITAWVRQERPDVVIVGNPPDLQRFKMELKRTKLSVRWALANSRPFVRGEAGLDERHDLIGVAAVDALVGLVTRGERGIPRIATTISISGEWST